MMSIRDVKKVKERLAFWDLTRVSKTPTGRVGHVSVF